jgi:curli biogenesis system outer membrane secretion channel CsgG
MKVHRPVVLSALVLLACSCTTTPTLPDELVFRPVGMKERVDLKGIRRLAVMEFRNYTENKEAPARVEGLLTAEFQKSGRFELLERSQMEKALQEVALGQTGLLDEKTAKEAGRLIGADAVLVGEISSYQHEVKQIEYHYQRERSQVIPLPPGDRTPDIVTLPSESRTYTVEKYNASIGFSLRMISVGTGEVLWSKHVARSFGMREGEYEIRNVNALFDKLAEAAAREAVYDLMP